MLRASDGRVVIEQRVFFSKFRKHRPVHRSVANSCTCTCCSDYAAVHRFLSATKHMFLAHALFSVYCICARVLVIRIAMILSRCCIPPRLTVFSCTLSLHSPISPHLSTHAAPPTQPSRSQSLRNVTHLSLAANTLGDEGCATLCGTLRELPALQHLDLSANGIGDLGASKDRTR